MRKFFGLLPCITATLCLMVGLTACGKEKNNGRQDSQQDEQQGGGQTQEITLTADMDFTALVSEKVDAAGWDKAFDFKNYGINFTSKLYHEHYRNPENYVFKHNVNEVFYSFTDRESNFECSMKCENDVYSYYYYDIVTGEKFIERADESNEEYEHMKKTHESYATMVAFCPNFSNRFDAFTYDEAKHSYVSAQAEGTTYFEDFSSEGGKDYSTYLDIEIKIINGRLAYLKVFEEHAETGIVNGELKIIGYYKDKSEQCFFDFGKTTIEYKQVS